MFPVVVSTFKTCVHDICVCVYTETGEAFVDVMILGAGDDLLNSAAGRPRYEGISTPARKGHVEPRALDGARFFFFSVHVL